MPWMASVGRFTFSPASLCAALHPDAPRRPCSRGTLMLAWRLWQRSTRWRYDSEALRAEATPWCILARVLLPWGSYARRLARTFLAAGDTLMSSCCYCPLALALFPCATARPRRDITARIAGSPLLSPSGCAAQARACFPAWPSVAASIRSAVLWAFACASPRTLGRDLHRALE